jgi:HSP20 family protein
MFALMPWRKGKRAAALAPRGGRFPLLEEFETLFEPFFFRWPMMLPEEFEKTWGAEVEPTEKEVVVRAELPGFEPNEIEVHLVGEVLIIEARHGEPVPEEKKEKEAIKEVPYAHVRREITLPAGVEAEKAVATYRNGILEVRFPKLPEAVGRRIEVKV